VNPKHFRAPNAGRIIKTAQGYTAFVPAPLPPKLEYDEGFVMALSRADAALSELSGLGRHLPNPHLLIAPYVRQEAVLSSRIEVTKASLSYLLRHEVERPVLQKEDDDVREVQNYVDALEYGLKRLKKLPLSLRLVRELHARLMKGVRGERATAGEFRRSQNWIGPAGSTPETAPYVPPPVAYLDEALADWERFLHERALFPDLVHCAIMHEQFEAIHPFLDGNGRVGRLLITLFLVERGRLSQPLLYLSAYIEAHRQEYYDLLQRVRTRGDWLSWLRFFITGVTEMSVEAVGHASQLMNLREKFRARFRDKVHAVRLLDELFMNPYMSVSRAQDILKVSNPTARKAVMLLQQKGLLQEVTGRDWGKLYLATPIMEIIEQGREG